MARPPSATLSIARIIQAQVDRIEKESEVRDLTADEWSILERAAKLTRLVTEPMTAEEKAKLSPDELVDALKKQRDPILFPKHGPKKTSNMSQIHPLSEPKAE